MGQLFEAVVDYLTEDDWKFNVVKDDTALMLSFKSLYTRTTGQEMTLSRLKELEVKAAQKLYEHPANQLIAGLQIEQIEHLTESIEKIEKGVLDCARELPCYARLLTLPDRPAWNQDFC